MLLLLKTGFGRWLKDGLISGLFGFVGGLTGSGLDFKDERLAGGILLVSFGLTLGGFAGLGGLFLLLELI